MEKLLCCVRKIVMNSKEKVTIKPVGKGKQVTQKEYDEIVKKKTEEMMEMNSGPNGQRQFSELADNLLIIMKKILLLLIMALSTSAFSQNIRFEGIIKDSTGLGLDMANVMAVNQETKAHGRICDY